MWVYQFVKRQSKIDFDRQKSQWAAVPKKPATFQSDLESETAKLIAEAQGEPVGLADRADWPNEPGADADFRTADRRSGFV